MEKNQKPPTQGVGVQGFKADQYASDEVKIDWAILIHVPKYQMFVVEKSSLSHENIMEWVDGYTKDCIRGNGDQDFYNSYVQWHDQKGYWKNEDPYGVLITNG